jgi:hypothetical protein
MRANFERYRAYIRATVSHLIKTLDDMEMHQSGDPDLQDSVGMMVAAYAKDTDAGIKFPASGLPHVAHAVASLNMAIAQAVNGELLPADPGKPWEGASDAKWEGAGAKSESHTIKSTRFAYTKLD